ncbi:hypothetical protein CRV15_34485 (plasmid) [Streptomyces clavuligerus]|uniref:Thioesterase family protein n=1 Tax=Streptomyces clavuligerus TaxID=1901 RepID=D5SLJ9_STRCL|nr:Hypothetical protein SCLAV_p1306 [Streptomyces clavuligerus]MBY6306760.1 hypothetical protein [Streptomyces clavuligerus]QCS10636.1 hypothetical protein CRV15_34485 [Streptomyces clavuligerus]QPJ98431.1 hypothetical protein GE265_29990 [Streptomyces clavuligerus]
MHAFADRPALGTIRVARRHNGPPDSANGGYVSGLVAERARRALETLRETAREPEGDLAVQLHAPPPLATDLTLTGAGRRVHVWHGEHLVATASPQPPVADTVDFVPPSLAERAMSAYGGHRHHPFPGCFVCGPARPDGLRLAPGPVPGGPDSRVACLWTPGADCDDGTGTAAAELVWAALDCPGGWTLDPSRSPLVLGRMAARITERPRIGETVVLTGRGTPGDGRTLTCVTALFRADGTELGRATATWVRLTTATPLQHRKVGSS